MTPKTRVLIVDDNAGMRRTLAMILSRKGYAVEVAEDGATALQKVQQMNFDVALMDIKMPVINGVEALKQIRTIRPTIAVILMTAYAMDEDDLTAQGLQAGAYDVLYKPLNLEHTFELINRARQASNGVLLLIEDDLDLSQSLSCLLERRGYSLDVAYTGEAAIELARRRQYDIILVDINLPVRNGLDTFLAIRQIDPTVTAIILTGFRQEMDDLVQAALENGAYTCLYKPLDFDQMFRVLAEVG